jgi:RNA polymerase sigma-70 factor, ECF subfamily
MEEQIITLLQTQNKEAISLLYDNYSSALYGVVLRIVRSPDVAQDVMQDSFVKAWKYGPNYDASKGRLFTWLLNIARNTAIDVTRSSAFRMSEKTVDLKSLVGFGGATNNPEHIGLRKIVDSLDPKYRTLVDLVYFQGYTQQEVEKELNIPIGTIKTRLRAAISELRKSFGETSIKQFAALIVALELFANN